MNRKSTFTTWNRYNPRETFESPRLHFLDYLPSDRADLDEITEPALDQRLDRTPSMFKTVVATERG
jgi:hypothetical protein